MRRLRTILILAALLCALSPQAHAWPASPGQVLAFQSVTVALSGWLSRLLEKTGAYIDPWGNDATFEVHGAGEQHGRETSNS